MRKTGKLLALALMLAMLVSVLVTSSIFAAGEPVSSEIKTLYSQNVTKPSIANVPADMTVTQNTSANGVKYYTVAYKEGWSVEKGGYTKEPYVQIAPAAHYLKDGWRDKDTQQHDDDTDYLIIDFDISTDTNQFDQLYFQTLFYYGKKEAQADGSYKGKRTSAQSGHYSLHGDSGEDFYFTESTAASTKISVGVQPGEEWAHVTMVVDATADTSRTMHLYYNGQYVSSRVCMTDNATYLESLRISLGTAGVAPDIDNESFSIANATIKSFPKGYTGELAEEKANLGKENYPLSSFSDLGYCLNGLPENTIAEITRADSAEPISVTRISELDGNLQAGDTVKLYRDIARKIVVPGKAEGDAVIPDVTFDLNGHSMVEPLALADYAELDWIIRDGNGDLYSYTNADDATVYAKGAQVYTDGALTTDTLDAYFKDGFGGSIGGGKIAKITFLKDTTIKLTQSLKYGNTRTTYDLNGKALTIAGGKVPFQSGDGSARVFVRDGKLINNASNPFYATHNARFYLVDVELVANSSVSDIRNGKMLLIGCDIESKNTVVALKSATSAILDGCTIKATSAAPLFAGNLSSSGTRHGSINCFIGVYNTVATTDASIYSIAYYANEYQSGTAAQKANQNKLTLSIQGSSLTTDNGSPISIGIESLLDKNNSYAFAEGFDATTDIYIDKCSFNTEYIVATDDETAAAAIKTNNATVGAYTAHTNVMIKRSQLKTGNYVFLNTVGSGDANGAISATLCDNVKLSSNVWAAESNSAVNVEFAEGVKLAYSYNADYPYIATLNWTEDTLVGNRPDRTTVRMSPVFADGMILQGHKNINIYGSCATVGATIEVTLGDKTVTTTVGGDGKWSATLPPMDYANGLTLTVNEVGLLFPETKFENVHVGELWVMAGQSNSVYGAYKMEDFAEYRSNADNFDNIYAFAVYQTQSLVERTEASNSGWYKVTSQTLTKDDRYTGVSAIAYVMATRLATELGEDVAIGIIDINFNGSTVEAWMSAENLAEVDPALSEKYNAYRSFYEKNGAYPSESDVAEYGSYIASGKLYQRMACACYNGMIAPFFGGFTVRGAVWYQGEGNAASVTATSDGDYGKHFNGVRNSFRDAFGDESLPMFIIQTPARMSDPFYFRALQYELARQDANTYVVTSTSSGVTFSANELKYTSPDGDSMVHYERKSPVGLAVADSVLENVYGLDRDSSPKILSVQKSGNAIVITFDRELTIDSGYEMLGFDIAGADGVWVAAKATYADKKVTLTADGVSAPERVRYGCGLAILTLADGTEIVYNKNYAKFVYDEAAGTVTITVGENVYVIDTNDPAVIGARMNGNVVATSGAALPVFLATAE